MLKIVRVDAQGKEVGEPIIIPTLVTHPDFQGTTTVGSGPAPGFEKEYDIKYAKLHWYNQLDNAPGITDRDYDVDVPANSDTKDFIWSLFQKHSVPRPRVNALCKKHGVIHLNTDLTCRAAVSIAHALEVTKEY